MRARLAPLRRIPPFIRCQQTPTKYHSTASAELVGPKGQPLSEMSLREKLEHFDNYPPSERVIPRIDLSSFYQQLKPPSAMFPSMPALTPQKAKRPTFVKLRGSPLLTIDDFRRIVPVGKHIPSWQMHVLPIASYQSKDKRGDHYILFDSVRAAELYIYLAQHHHYLCGKAYTFTVQTTVDIPFGLDYDGHDLQRVVRRYTLFPPFRPLKMSIVNEPDSLLSQFLESKVWRKRRKVVDLTVSTRGVRFGTDTLLSLIDSHGRRRGIPWNAQVVHVSAAETTDFINPRLHSFRVTLPDELEAVRFVDAWHSRRMRFVSDDSKTDIIIHCSICAST